jgi:ACS family pantothenate transporter-like MFS transporter
MGLRFFIGLAEASAYPGGMWLLGSWYDKGELGKRAVLFMCSSSIGTMFSGYLQ